MIIQYMLLHIRLFRWHDTLINILCLGLLLIAKKERAVVAVY